MEMLDLKEFALSNLEKQIYQCFPTPAVTKPMNPYQGLKLRDVSECRRFADATKPTNIPQGLKRAGLTEKTYYRREPMS